MDKYYLEDEGQEAGNFLRKNFKNSLLRSNNFIGNNLATADRKIEVIGTPGRIGQIAEANAKIKAWVKQGVDQSKIAVVLADESMLFPFLSAVIQISPFLPLIIISTPFD